VGPKGASYKVNETAFHNAMGTDKPLWEWMTQRLPSNQVTSDGPGYPGVPELARCEPTIDQQGLVGRPELSNFALAMVGGGRASGAAHAFGIIPLGTNVSEKYNLRLLIGSKTFPGAT
jgi:hypothetical protein